MSKLIFLFYFVCIVSADSIGNSRIIHEQKVSRDTIPAYLLGNFSDDYAIHYNITDSLWSQETGIKYHIIEWNLKEQYLIAKNDQNNPSEKGLYTRIDFMQFTGMEPYLWGFCLTVYNAVSDTAARSSTAADRVNPRKGCNGYPFSRMKRMDQ